MSARPEDVVDSVVKTLDSLDFSQIENGMADGDRLTTALSLLHDSVARARNLADVHTTFKGARGLLELDLLFLDHDGDDYADLFALVFLLPGGERVKLHYSVGEWEFEASDGWPESGVLSMADPIGRLVANLTGIEPGSGQDQAELLDKVVQAMPDEDSIRAVCTAVFDVHEAEDQVYRLPYPIGMTGAEYAKVAQAVPVH